MQTIKEAAENANVTIRSIYRWIREGYVTAQKGVRNGRIQRLLSEEEVEKIARNK